MARWHFVTTLSSTFLLATIRRTAQQQQQQLLNNIVSAVNQWTAQNATKTRKCCGSLRLSLNRMSRQACRVVWMDGWMAVRNYYHGRHVTLKNTPSDPVGTRIRLEGFPIVILYACSVLIRREQNEFSI